MKKTLLTMLALFALAFAPAKASAHHTPDGSDHDVAVKVNGLVCDFCAQSLDRLFSRENAINHVHVDLRNGMITLDFNESQNMDDEKVKKIVTDSGYSVVEIRRGS